MSFYQTGISGHDHRRVKFTVKEKIDQEKRSEDDIAKGIVKFNVDVYDEEGETVALATILTMVKKMDQSV